MNVYAKRELKNERAILIGICRARKSAGEGALFFYKMLGERMVGVVGFKPTTD
jgi:hypothetical protein